MFLRLSDKDEINGFFIGSGIGCPFLGEACFYSGATEVDLRFFLANLSASNFASKSYFRCSS
jgi:hypothetical protein